MERYAQFFLVASELICKYGKVASGIGERSGKLEVKAVFAVKERSLAFVNELHPAFRNVFGNNRIASHIGHKHLYVPVCHVVGGIVVSPRYLIHHPAVNAKLIGRINRFGETVDVQKAERSHGRV